MKESSVVKLVRAFDEYKYGRGFRLHDHPEEKAEVERRLLAKVLKKKRKKK